MRQLKITNSITNRNTESLDKYLNDVSREELIDVEKEVELARRIKQGDHDALDQLVKANLRFVISVAKQYQGQGLSLADLICEGNIGLIKAAIRFDETKGFKFISYSVWWIRNAILQALAENSKLIKIPQNRQESMTKINRSINKLEQLLGRTPTIEEVADDIELSLDKVNDLIKFKNDKISLDSSITDDSKGTLIDILENEDTPPTDYNLQIESMQQDIHVALNALGERERLILKYTFGLEGIQYPPERIAEELGISVERTRQIRERAIIRLRHLSGIPKLRRYLA